MRKLGVAVSSAVLVFSAACTQDLNVTNPNNPDLKRAQANPSDVQSLAASSVNAWYNNSVSRDPWVMLNVTGDLETMNYGNFGARFNNLQPRIPYANDAANNDIEVTQVPWEGEYAAIGEANDVLTAIGGGLELPGGTPKYKALAQFSQAAAYVQLALIFDKAYTVDETYKPGVDAAPTLKPYSEVEAFALSKLDALIAATTPNSGTGADTAVYTSAEFPVQGLLDGGKLYQVANTMAAQLLAYTPRTKADAAKVDWNKVLKYADQGILDDFVIVGKGDFIWWSEYMGYNDLPSWMRVDQKLIHKMAPNVPDTYNGTPVGPTGTYDARLGYDTLQTESTGLDYVYTGKVIGSASRGIYMQSPYVHERYIDVSWEASVSFDGPMPYILKAENDLLRAEALIRTGGDRNLAATLVNNTRVGRGKLTPLTAANTDQEFYDAILYEREVELNGTDGFGFFALRHEDELQDGTVRHLPVPATELETVGLPVYTFGGVGKPDMNVYSAAPLSLSMALTPRPGAAKQLVLPNGRVMSIRPPHANRMPTIAGIR